VDENKRAMYYNEEFRDIIVKSIAMKSRWQIQQFKPFADNIICFLDEPILSAFGSSTYVSVKREDVVSILAEVIEAVRAEGAIPGIHCCGNTEWSILIDAGVDIVNFDLASETIQKGLWYRHTAQAFGKARDSSGADDSDREVNCRN
jgi:hypothetical protein